MSKEAKKFQDMFVEVEGIVQKLSNQQLDLDDMVTHIEQGYKLIKDMRGRLEATKLTVEKLRAENEESEK